MSRYTQLSSTTPQSSTSLNPPPSSPSSSLDRIKLTISLEPYEQLTILLLYTLPPTATFLTLHTTHDTLISTTQQILICTFTLAITKKAFYNVPLKIIFAHEKRNLTHSLKTGLLLLPITLISVFTLMTLWWRFFPYPRLELLSFQFPL